MRSRPGQLHSIRRKREEEFLSSLDRHMAKMELSHQRLMNMSVACANEQIVDYTKLHGTAH